MAATETAVIVTTLKAGSLAAAITLITTDLELVMVLIVGLTGGLIYSFREIVHLEVKTTKLKAFSELLFTIPMSVSTAGIVYYIGVNVINEYINFPNVVWIFLALLASLHYKNVISFFTKTMANLITNFSNKGSK